MGSGIPWCHVGPVPSAAMELTTVLGCHFAAVDRTVIQLYFPRIFVVVGYRLIYPCPNGLLQWHWGHCEIVQTQMKQSRIIWVLVSHESTRTDDRTASKQNKTKHRQNLCMAKSVKLPMSQLRAVGFLSLLAWVRILHPWSKLSVDCRDVFSVRVCISPRYVSWIILYGTLHATVQDTSYKKKWPMKTWSIITGISISCGQIPAGHQQLPCWLSYVFHFGFSTPFTG